MTSNVTFLYAQRLRFISLSAAPYKFRRRTGPVVNLSGYSKNVVIIFFFSPLFFTFRRTHLYNNKIVITRMRTYTYAYAFSVRKNAALSVLCATTRSRPGEERFFFFFSVF